MCNGGREYEPRTEIQRTHVFKRIYFNMYKLLQSSNLSVFFEEQKGLTSLSKAILKHYLLVTDDFNVGMKSKSLGYDRLGEFCDLFNLTN